MTSHFGNNIANNYTHIYNKMNIIKNYIIPQPPYSFHNKELNKEKWSLISQISKAKEKDALLFFPFLLFICKSSSLMVSTSSSFRSLIFPHWHRWLNFPWSASPVWYRAHLRLERPKKKLEAICILSWRHLHNCARLYLVDGGACSSLDRLNEGLILSGSNQERRGDSGGADKGWKRSHRGQRFAALL